MFSPTTGVFTVAAPLPLALAEKDDGVVLNDRVFSIGGERKVVLTGCSDTDIQPLRAVFSFDATLGAWANETLLPDARMRFASATYNNILYLFGGQGPVMDGASSTPFIPVLYSSYSYAPPAGGGGIAAPSYSAGAMAGAAIGTAAAALLLVGVSVYTARKCRSGGCGGCCGGGTGGPKQLLEVRAAAV